MDQRYKFPGELIRQIGWSSGYLLPKAATRPVTCLGIIFSLILLEGCGSKPSSDAFLCPYGSIIECVSQTARSSTRLAGTNFRLHYASNRLPGYKGGQTWDANSRGLGGWTLSVNHTYDPQKKILYLGNGPERSVEALALVPSGELAVASEDGRELYIFDSAGLHLRTVNALQGLPQYHFAYDSTGRLENVKDSDGPIITLKRDKNGKDLEIVAHNGHSTKLSLDPNGYLARIRAPGAQTVSFEYTSNGLLTKLENPGGQFSRFAYDGDGRLTKIENPGTATTLARTDSRSGSKVDLTSALGRVTSYITERISADTLRRIKVAPSGIRTEETINDDGSRTVIYPDGTRLSAQWVPDPRWGMQAPFLKQLTLSTPGGLSTTIAGERTITLAKQDDPLGLKALMETVTVNDQKFTRQYDAASRTFTNTSPSRRKVVATHDSQGRPSSILAGPKKLSYVYDSEGRPMELTEGAGPSARKTALTYGDGEGVLEITDPLDRTSTFLYNAAGQLRLQSRPGGQLVTYLYDPAGNLRTVIPPRRQPHKFAYTKSNQPAAYIPPKVGAESNETRTVYNGDDQITKVEFSDGQGLELTYDKSGRHINSKLPRGTISIDYDSKTGQLARITAPAGININYAYDGGLLVSEAWSGTVAAKVNRTHDSSMRIIARDINGAGKIDFRYDEDGQVIAAGEMSLSRDADNALVTSAKIGTVTSVWDYNDFGELVKASSESKGKKLHSVDYKRDKLGRIIRRVETIDGKTDTFDYTYDEAGRLARVQKNRATIQEYVYDHNGNRLRVTASVRTTKASYDGQDRLTQDGNANYEYSASGYLQSKSDNGKTTRYDYDSLGNLLAVNLPSGKKIEYLVDGRNRRIGKRVNGSLVSGFVYQDELRPIAELDPNGRITSRFVYATDRNVPDYMVKGQNIYRILTDHVGSPRLVVDVGTGAIKQQIDYDAFGNVIDDTNPGFQPFGFAGGLYDSDTKLVRFGARDYEAETGRWTAKDPSGFMGGDSNLYSYALGDPLNRVDPQGLESWPPVQTSPAGTFESIRSLLLGPVDPAGSFQVGTLWLPQNQPGYFYGFGPVHTPAWNITPGIGSFPGTVSSQHFLSPLDAWALQQTRMADLGPSTYAPYSLDSPVDIIGWPETPLLVPRTKIPYRPDPSLDPPPFNESPDVPAPQPAQSHELDTPSKTKDGFPIDTCLIGTWELDNESYKKWINDNMKIDHPLGLGKTVMKINLPVKGSWRITFRRDGTFTSNVRNFEYVEEKTTAVFVVVRSKTISTVNSVATGQFASGPDGHLCSHGRISGNLITTTSSDLRTSSKTETHQASGESFSDILTWFPYAVTYLGTPEKSMNNRYACGKDRLVLTQAHGLSGWAEMKLVFKRVSSCEAPRSRHVHCPAVNFTVPDNLQDLKKMVKNQWIGYCVMRSRTGELVDTNPTLGYWWDNGLSAKVGQQVTLQANYNMSKDCGRVDTIDFSVPGIWHAGPNKSQSFPLPSGTQHSCNGTCQESDFNEIFQEWFKNGFKNEFGEMLDETIEGLDRIGEVLEDRSRGLQEAHSRDDYWEMANILGDMAAFVLARRPANLETLNVGDAMNQALSNPGTALRQGASNLADAMKDLMNERFRNAGPPLGEALGMVDVIYLGIVSEIDEISKLLPQVGDRNPQVSGEALGRLLAKAVTAVASFAGPGTVVKGGTLVVKGATKAVKGATIAAKQSDFVQHCIQRSKQLVRDTKGAMGGRLLPSARPALVKQITDDIGKLGLATKVERRAARKQFLDLMDEIDQRSPRTLKEFQSEFPNHTAHDLVGDRWKGWISLDPVPGNRNALKGSRLIVRPSADGFRFRVIPHL